eukprot:CAMPEP_0195512176 /NCGR_PEP_ID=MMETSP0794_2-20130614/4221_1 /TAXON_ID=515487 /ORGANISM="Stephanopyxis turris, Strain CCMP 815" /LENGTH=554 /DNA_ID=CAMNT_0040639903 /DNA_START=133 /DNA_END=1797 /DNA_ORIENTATION=+
MAYSLDDDDVDSVYTDSFSLTPSIMNGTSEGLDNRSNNKGSSVMGATFNFTNAIIGAGAMGLGGAIQVSGGLISIFSIIFFGSLAKYSADLIIFLTLHVQHQQSQEDLASQRRRSGTQRNNNNDVSVVTYETLGQLSFGTVGIFCVVFSKAVYSFGCLVAYLIVIKDNFGSGLEGAIYGNTTSSGDADSFRQLLQNEILLTAILSAIIVLPLCLFRSIGPLAKFSFISILAMLSIAGIVLYLIIVNPGGNVRVESTGTVFEDWFEVKPGIFESLGTFVFTFVAQHTVHLTFESLKPKDRNFASWKRVSLFSILISGFVSLTVGVVVYMTFYQETRSDIFEMYPPSGAIDAAKIFLSVSMLLTFALPFFTCREMIVVMISQLCCGCSKNQVRRNKRELGLRESLLRPATALNDYDHDYIEGIESDDDAYEKNVLFLCDDEDDLLPVEQHGIIPPIPNKSWLISGEERQLVLPYHILLTVLLWGVTTALALSAPSLGDVLDLVGCLSGTVIAFLLPGLFHLKLVGFSHLAVMMVVIGALVGSVGTYFSLRKLVMDV